MIKVKIDENITVLLVSILRKFGYKSDTVYSENISGINDEKLWDIAKSENRILITLDLDFSDIRKYKVSKKSGIILLRPKTKGPKGVIKLVNKLLRNYKLNGLLGKLVVVDNNKIRIRENL